MPIKIPKRLFRSLIKITKPKPKEIIVKGGWKFDGKVNPQHTLTIPDIPQIIKSEPYARIAPSDGRINTAVSYQIGTNPTNAFQLIKDTEPKYYSIHFKTQGKNALNSNQKNALFQAVANDIPEGSRLSTWGTVSPGGLHGLQRFESLGFKPTLETRSLGMKSSLTPEIASKYGEVIGDRIEVPILYKPKEVIAGSRPISEAEFKGVPKSERNQTAKVLDYDSRELQNFLKSKFNIEQRSKLPYTLEEIEHLPEEYQINALKGRSRFIKEMSDKMKNYLDDPDKIKEFNALLKDYASQIESNIDPRIASTFKDGIEQPSIAVIGFRNYLKHSGVDASELSNEELAKILTQQYKILSEGATGKLKEDILWHGSPKWFDSFDFSHTGEHTGNSGALGPGNYFSLIAGPYGRTISTIDYTTKLNNTQPYIVTEIQSTPNGKIMIEKGILPKYIGPDELMTEQGQAKLNDIIANIPKNDNRAYIDLSERAASMGSDYIGPSAGIMIRRNTGIKSLYPHPSRFIRNADGTVSLIPTNWLDTRVNFKEGGVLKAQFGLSHLSPSAINQSIDKFKQTKVGKTLNGFFNGADSSLSDEEYVQKHGYAKPIGGIGILGAVVAPEWEGVEGPIVAENFGYNGIRGPRPIRMPRPKVNPAPKPKPKPKPVSNWEKFLQNPVEKQDAAVRTWNAERFKSFNELKQNPEWLRKFKYHVNHFKLNK